MKFARNPQDDVDQLLLNARLRDEIEPYVDDSLELLNLGAMPTKKENEYLASMLAWERAPVLPISEWFQPALALPKPELLSDEEMRLRLHETLKQLNEKRIVLDFTEHLSDRQLYCLILRDILPSHEKKIETPRNFLHWYCLDMDQDLETWLRYYATEEEREVWSEETNQTPPPSEKPPYPRKMPRRPRLS